MPDTYDHEEGTVTYQCKFPAPVWADWRETVPRSMRLSDRLRTLVKQDLRAATAHDDTEAATIEVIRTRVHMRAIQATATLREAEPEEYPDAIAEAREHMESIIDLTELVDE